MSWLSRLLPGPDKSAVASAERKIARLDAEIEAQDVRLALTAALVKSNETAAERLVAALTRDRTR